MENVKNDAICHVTRQNQYNPARGGATIMGCLNVIAPCLSRAHQIKGTEWHLYPEGMALAFELWGFQTVDKFITVHNSQLLQFMSPVPDNGALAVNALSQPWQGR